MISNKKIINFKVIFGEYPTFFLVWGFMREMRGVPLYAKKEGCMPESRGGVYYAHK